MKQNWRTKLKKLKIEQNDLDDLSLKLASNLNPFLSFLSLLSTDCVFGVYGPIKEEPVWFKGHDQHFKNQLAFPSIDGKKQMVFKKANLDELIVRTDFKTSILGPKDKSLIVTPNIVIVPGLAFSKKGDRLGRGKGYYDRYLENFDGVKVGLCFEQQLFEKIPHEKHDVKMDYIITEENIYKR